MTVWKCSNCGYQLSVDPPPDVCPSCTYECDFVYVTCYPLDKIPTGLKNIHYRSVLTRTIPIIDYNKMLNFKSNNVTTQKIPSHPEENRMS